MNWLRKLFQEDAAAGATVLRAPAEAGATVLRPEEPEPPADADEPVAFPLAERLPPAYSVRRVLGMGGMGAVLLAHHREWDIEVVLKVPRPEILDDPAAAPRIRREAEAWTSLGLHPHIVYCYFVLPVDEVPVVVIEHLTGGNLRQRWAAGQSDGLRGTLDLAIQLCHGLEHAHQAGLVHRDIKPENLLLDADGTLKVTDFGISLVEGAARLGGPAAHDGPLTMAGLGTRGYMAPEQWLDAHKVDGRADIFALGVCLYEWLDGARPYEGTAGARLEAPEPPRSLPAALRALMRQSVDWYRDARPASVREVRERLGEVYRAEFGAPSAFTELPRAEPEADGWNNRGVSFLELARPADALDAFGRALRANPYHFEAARNRTLLRWRRGESDDTEALLVLDQLAASPGADTRQIALARAEVHQERFDPAEARRALAAWPGLYEEHFGGREASAVARARSVQAYPGCMAPTLAVSTDLRRALTSGQQRLVKCWDLDKLECLREFGDTARQVNRLAISPGGRWGLLGWRESALECWDLARGECVCRIEEPAAFQSVALGPDAVFGLGTTGVLKQWDLTTGVCIRKLADGQSAVACSADGALAVAGAYTGPLSVWDLASGEKLATLTGHTKRVSAIAIRADGRRALTGSDDATVLVWDLEGGKLVRTLPSHGYPILGLGVSSDGRLAVSLATDSCLRLWEVETGRCLRTIRGFPGEFSALAFPGGARRFVTMGGSGMLSVFEMDLSRPFAAAPRPSRPLAFSALQARQRERDASIAAVEAGLRGGEPSRAHQDLLGVWASIGYAAEPRIEELHARLLPLGRPAKPLAAHLLFSDAASGNENGVALVSLSADGKRAAASGGPGNFRVWDTARRAPAHTLPQANLFTVGLSADGRVAAGAGSGPPIRLWDAATGRLLHELENSVGFVRALALANDGSLCITCGGSQPARIWDTASGGLLHALEAPNAVAAAFTPDARTALTMNPDHVLRIWDVATGSCRHAITDAKLNPTPLAALPDGRRAVCGYGVNGLGLIDLDTGAIVRELPGQGRAPTCVAIPASGCHAVTGAEDNILRVLDLDSGACLLTIPTPYPVWTVSVSADASAVLAGHRSGYLSFWRLIWSLEFPS